MKLSFVLLLTLLVLSSAASACGSSDAGQAGGVTIEPLASATLRALPPIGGKPAAPVPTASVAAQPTDDPTADRDDITSPPEATEATNFTATPAPRASDGSVAPAEGRWIDVDVTTYAVRLMDGEIVAREIAPVGVGVEVDTGVYASTQTGLFYVNSKIEELAYDPPYDTYISHWVGFDESKANGFHSFLKDASGSVVDASTGRVSNGCIRTGEPDAVYAFAEIGMPVWVHW